MAQPGVHPIGLATNLSSTYLSEDTPRPSPPDPCQAFDPNQMASELQTLLKQLTAPYVIDSWRYGLAAPLTAVGLLDPSLQKYKPTYHLRWVYGIKDTSGDQDIPRRRESSWSDICFDPKYQWESFTSIFESSGISASLGHFLPEKRMILITEVCGWEYVTDMAVKSGPFFIFPSDAIEEFDLGPIYRQETTPLINWLYFTVNPIHDTYPAVFFGGQFFARLDGFSEGHPYRLEGFDCVTHAPIENSSNGRVPDDLWEIDQRSTTGIMNFKRRLGICPI